MNISFLTVSIGSLTGSGVMLLYIHTTLKSVSEPEGLPASLPLEAISPSSDACASSVARAPRLWMHQCNYVSIEICIDIVTFNLLYCDLLLSLDVLSLLSFPYDCLS